MVWGEKCVFQQEIVSMRLETLNYVHDTISAITKFKFVSFEGMVLKLRSLCENGIQVTIDLKKDYPAGVILVLLECEKASPGLKSYLNLSTIETKLNTKVFQKTKTYLK